MRIVIDFQGAQTASRFRGIGRYTMALVQGMLRNADQHEIWLALNGALEEPIGAIRAAFDGLIPQDRIRVFQIPEPVAGWDPRNAVRQHCAELLREHFIEQLRPDVVLITSLFEGYTENAVASVGRFADGRLTAAILYDLIPHLNPDTYLASARQRASYARKIDSLRRAGLLLSISDYARQEAIDALGLDPEQVVSISTAVDASFAPGAPAPSSLAAFRERFGITRPILLYAPGGFDARKNIDGLISAYGLLPAPLRAGHQLVIASKMSELDQQALRAHGAGAGLGADQLVLTGYVSDAMLIDLYRAATLFVFASKHEGFGLPALEAMACGALVIGADNSSIPEVIGCQEALFDTSSPQAIADKMAQVLTDPALQQRLRAHGPRQAEKFSWDTTARRALRALEGQFARHQAASAAPPRRRLAFVAPAAPAAALLPALFDRFDIALIVPQAATLAPALAALPRHTPAWLLEHGAQFDQIVYQVSAAGAHAELAALLQAHPGVLVLQDGLPGAGGERGAPLYRAHGYPGLLAPDAFAAGLALLESATGVIVHAEPARAAAAACYGPDAVRDWQLVDLEHQPPALSARAFGDALDHALHGLAARRRALLHALARVPGLEQEQSTLHQLAIALAGLPDPLARRQLLVDAGAGAELGAGMLALLRRPPPGWRVEPVYLCNQDGHWHYRYAHRATLQRLALGYDGAHDAPVDCGGGDVCYLGADASAEAPAAAAAGLYAHWHALGVRIMLAPEAQDATRAALAPHAAPTLHGIEADPAPLLAALGITPG